MALLRTPWGKTEHFNILFEGITKYHTASHGGYKIIKKLNEAYIPLIFRKENGWYEEDCEQYIVTYFLYDLIYGKQSAGNFKGEAKRGLLRWFPAQYEVFFTEKLSDKDIQEAYSEQVSLEEKITLHKIAISALGNIKPYVIPQVGDVIVFEEPLMYNKKEYYRVEVVSYRKGKRALQLDGAFGAIPYGLMRSGRIKYHIIKAVPPVKMEYWEKYPPSKTGAWYLVESPRFSVSGFTVSLWTGAVWLSETHTDISDEVLRYHPNPLAKA
jgi:hypothetical protein